MQIKPFLKWVGGKTQLINEIKKRMPEEFNRYFEPFIGGGSLFINIHNNKNIKSVINDISSELINSYKAVQTNAEKLLKLLNEHEKNIC
ncbi:DNA adenine methylase [Spiroplasma citri]|uniref:DNA adenine methylase n=1 Tax=Spiroplasma citri TaxID=2133 RepID=A0AAX3SWZ9_SPICI|nr:DNA adenine methylase [Spiroplasma citri]WFG95785.1 DNA adenine methylase [Spiroplasma citri]WFG99667.1 DNA adenine methylase [Spiroplasma citri]